MATNIARRMVCEFGMSSKLGMIEYGEHSGEVFIARDLSTRSRNYSEETAQIIDEEIRRIVDEGYQRAFNILTECRERLDFITDALIEYETLEGDQVIEILETGELKSPPQKVLPPPLPDDMPDDEESDEEAVKEESYDDDSDELLDPEQISEPETESADEKPVESAEGRAKPVVVEDSSEESEEPQK